jgi:plastocyanin
MNTKVTIKLVVALFASAFFAGFPSAKAANANVEVGSNFFSPSSATINVGDTVFWTWSSGFHSASSDSGFFDSGVASVPHSFSFQFHSAGDFPYYCAVHSFPGNNGQNGVIHVQSANVAPSVTINSPANNAVYLYSPTNIDVHATASDSDGSINSVVFQLDGNTRATLTQTPYNATLSNVGSGAHTITVIATDNAGAQTTTSISVVVNSQPTVSFTAPANNSVAATSSNVTITAAGSDSDGTLSKLEIFSNGTSLGSSATSPFSITFAPPTSGIYTLTATATDNRGASTTATIQLNATVISLSAFKMLNNQFQFKVSGLVAPKSFVLQGASVLSNPVNWVGLQTNVAGADTFDFIDPESNTLNLRYYRVLELP